MNRFLTAFTVGAIWLAITATSSCKRDAGAAATPVSIQAAANNKDCWHYSVEDGCFAAVWLSPRLESAPARRFRFVNLVLHDLASVDSTALWASVAQCEGREDLLVSNGLLELKVAPIEDVTWGEVETRSELEFTVLRKSREPSRQATEGLQRNVR